MESSRVLKCWLLGRPIAKESRKQIDILNMICGLQKAGVQVFKKVFKYYLNTRKVFEYLNSI